MFLSPSPSLSFSLLQCFWSEDKSQIALARSFSFSFFYYISFHFIFIFPLAGNCTCRLQIKTKLSLSLSLQFVTHSSRSLGFECEQQCRRRKKSCWRKQRNFHGRIVFLTKTGKCEMKPILIWLLSVTPSPILKTLASVNSVSFSFSFCLVRVFFVLRLSIYELWIWIRF